MLESIKLPVKIWNVVEPLEFLVEKQEPQVLRFAQNDII